jgi:hypothetical protein
VEAVAELEFGAKPQAVGVVIEVADRLRFSFVRRSGMLSWWKPNRSPYFPVRHNAARKRWRLSYAILHRASAEKLLVGCAIPSRVRFPRTDSISRFAMNVYAERSGRSFSREKQRSCGHRN